ncbi:MAG: PKD domain-containing protein [Pirellulales bacterium]
MRRAWQFTTMWDSLRRQWRVRRVGGTHSQFDGQLLVRELEQRRVLSVSPAALVVAPVVLAGLGEGTALSLEPGEAAGANAPPVESPPPAAQDADPVPTTPDNESDPSSLASDIKPEVGDSLAADPATQSQASATDAPSPAATPLAEVQGLSITATSDQTVDEGALLAIVDIATFSDDSGSTDQTYTIDWGDGTMPTTGNATIDVPGGDGTPTEGSFDGSHTYADNGVYTVTVTIVRGEEVSVSDTLSVTVNNVTPSLTVAPNQTTTEGSSLAITNIGQFTDPGYDNLLNVGGETTEKFTFAVDWGDGTPLDSGPATIDVPGGPGSPTQGSFDGSHTYADNGVYTVTVTISDDDGGTTSGTFQVTVNNVAPALTVAPNQTTTEGTTLAIPNIGQFTDPGFDNLLNVGGETTEKFTFAVDWGDGTPLDSGPATIDVPGGPGTPTQGSFDGSHTYADNGVYTVTVTISDDDGGTTSANFQVTVNNVAPTLVVPPNQTVNEGDTLAITDIGVFTDPGYDNPQNVGGEISEKFTYAINWGDGTPLDSGPATIDVPGGPGTPTQGSFDGSHVYADNGVYTVTVTISDDDGGTTSAQFQVTVNNVAPTLVVPPDQVVDEGSTLSIPNIGQFTDPGYDNLLNVGGETTEKFTYAVDWGDGTPLDSGPATIDVPGGPGTPTQGSFDGSHVYADNGVYTVTVTISDDDGGTTSAQFQVTVNNVAPTLTVAPNQTTTEGSTLSITNIGQFTDPGYDNLLNVGGEISEKFTYAVDWGDGTPLDSGPATIDVPGGPGTPTQGSFDGSHTYADNGVYTVTVTISDDDGGTTSAQFQVTVNNVAPTLTVPPDQVVDEGDTLAIPNIGQFTDPGFDNLLNVGGETTEKFTFAVDWGDGTPLDSGPATIDVPGGPGTPTQGSFDGSHTYADNGVYTVTVTISDDDGGTTSAQFQVTVNNVAPTLVVPPNQTVDEGSTLSIPNIGQFTDPGFDNPNNTPSPTSETFTYAINWGDGTAPDTGPATIDAAGGIGSPTTGSFDGSHIYADNGVYTVTVTVIDDDGGTTSATFQVTVNNVAPTLTVPGDQTVGRNAPLTLNDIGVFADPGFDNLLNVGGETTERFTFSIDWGDGTSLDSGPATIDQPGGPGVQTGGSFNGQHVYTTGGIYTVTVTVSDDDGGSASGTFLVYVGPTISVAGQQTINEGSPLSIVGIGQYVDPTPVSVRPDGSGADAPYTFSINWGDGTTHDTGAASLSPGGEPGVAFSGSFDGAHTYADNGLYTVTVTITSPDGRVDTGTVLVTVNNVAPTLVVPGEQTVGQTRPLNLNPLGVFDDPGFDNLLNVGGETTERFTFAVNWGDGTPVQTGPAPITAPGSVGVLTAGSFLGGHTFAASGVFTVTVTVFDDDGGSASGTFTVTVASLIPQNLIFLPPGGGTQPPDRPTEIVQSAQPFVAPQTTRNEFVRFRSASVAGAETRVVLRVVLPSGVEDKEHDEVLPTEVLDDLRSLFKRLPDGRYRIFLVQPDGIERLVVDVIVREGRSIDIADESSDVGELPPRPNDAPVAAPPAGPENQLPADAPPGAAPGAEAPPANLPVDDANRSGSADDDRTRTLEAAIAAGGVALTLGPARRARRIARGNAGPAQPPLTKASRLLRRGRGE